MSGEKRNLLLLYLLFFLVNANFLAPVLVVFLKSTSLTVSQVFVIKAVAALLVVLTQIPTGVYADKVSKKLSIVWACVFYFLGSVILLFPVSFVSALVSVSLLAFSISLFTGAVSALTYESADDFRRVVGFQEFVRVFSLGLAVIGGGFLFEYYKLLPVVLMSVFAFVAVIISLFLKGKQRVKGFVDLFLADFLNFTKYFKGYFSNNNLFWVTLVNSIVLNIGLLLLLYLQLLLEAFGVRVSFFGLIFAGLVFFQGVGSQFIVRFRRDVSVNSLLFLVVSSLFLVSWLFLFLEGVWFLVVAGFFFFLIGLLAPIVADFKHVFFRDDERAAMDSVPSIIDGVTLFFLSALFSVVSEFLPLQSALVVVPMVLLVTLFFVFKVR